ncbi:MAG: ATPase [Caenibius sp.]
MGTDRHLIAVGQTTNSQTQGSEAEAETSESTTTMDSESSTGEQVLELEGYETWETAEDGEYTATSRLRGEWVMPWLAALAVTGWTAFFGWVHQGEIASGTTPAQWLGWIVDWSVPVLLVVAIWLLVMRTSKREAARFNDTASALSAESARLESRLLTVNRELSMARDFIAAQSRDIESLGRVACDRLSTHSERLVELIRDNGEQVDAIASVSTTALENMDRLRSELPVIANSARDVTNQIGGAGQTAKGQLDTLITGFQRLNEFGTASERQVEALRERVDTVLAAFEAQISRFTEIADTRFAALDEQGTAFEARLGSKEVASQAAMRRRMETLTGELDEAFAAVSDKEEDALASLQGRITALREESIAMSERLREEESGVLANWEAATANMRADLTKALEEIASLDRSTTQAAQERLDALRKVAERMDIELAERASHFFAELEDRRNTADHLQEQTAAAMDSRLHAFDTALEAKRQAHEDATRSLTAEGEALAAHVDQLMQQVTQIAAQGDHVQGKLSRSLDSLNEQLMEQIEQIAAQSEYVQTGLTQSLDILRQNVSESREGLAGTDTEVARLTDASVRLLELIVAASEHSREKLPEAIGAAEGRLGMLTEETERLRFMLTEAEERSRSLSDYVLAAQRDGAATQEQVASLYDQITQRHVSSSGKLAELRDTLEQLQSRSDEVADHNEARLRDAVNALEQAMTRVTTELQNNAREAVDALINRIGDESAEVIERAVRQQASESIGALEGSLATVSAASRDMTVQLRDQLAKVDELTGHLESRVALARQRAEEQENDDFTRRVALITEALNSKAIDISKALSNDVTDTAWAAYLKGDRGIFTRRAVRLLDSADSRAIVQVYESDMDFRSHVNRYVHDFESMLRQLLSTRDGHALSVTVLSSDMGKLYVALAQAIERLRA